MDFDFTTETITPDNTGIITIGGLQGLEVPASTSANRPSTPALGILRVNTDSTTAAVLEYWNGSSWLASDGTVTTVSVATANGLAGTVATSSSTPVITLSTTVTGVVVGNGTSLSAATASTSFPGYSAGLAGGVAGSVPYQSAANATGFSAAGTANQILQSNGTTAPTWTSAPTISGANITAATITNSSLANSSITVTGSTGLGVTGSPVSLGGTITLSNTGVTSNVAGTGISISGSTGAVTITNTGITSAVAGTNISITTTAGASTINVIAAPSFTGQVTSTLATGSAPFVVASTTAVANLQSQYASNLYGGTTGSLHYQSAANTSAFLADVALGSVLISQGVGVAPAWSASPTFSGANLTSASVSNSALANPSLTIGTTSLALGSTTTALAGIVSLTLTSVTSNLTGIGSPVNGSDAVPLSYLQGVLAGLSWKAEAQVATTANITGTYANGASGNGATFTTATTVNALDGVTLAVGNRVLIKDQTTQLQNGIYTVTTIGVTTTFTRSTDANSSSSIDNATLYVTSGTVYGGTAWTQTAPNPTVGTTAIVFVQTAGAGGNAVTSFQTSLSGLSPGSGTSGAVTLSGTLGLSSGGTSANLTATNGGIVYSGVSALAISAAGTTNQILQSTGAGTPTWTSTPTVTGTNFTGIPNAALINSSITVTGSTGLTVSGSPVALGGTLTLTNSGVTSAVATAGNITVSAATGVVTFNLATAGTAGTYGIVTTDTFGRVTAGTVITPVINGGTGVATLTTNGIVFGNGTSPAGVTSAGTTGQVLTSTTGAAPAFATLSTIAVTSITGTANQITASSSTGAVTLSTPATFIAPGSIASTSTITAGTSLTITGNTANSFLYSGAAGLVGSTAAATNGQLLIGSTGAVPSLAALTSGSNIYITNAAGSITIAGPKFYSEFTTAPTVAPSSSASQAIAIGSGSSASNYGVIALANGNFATAGDAQGMKAVFRNLTTTATATELFLDGTGAAQRLVMPASSAWTFSIKLIARSTSATGTYGAWIFTGMIYREATAGTTTMVGISKTTIARVGVVVANDPVVSADTTNGSLKILVTGLASTTMRWVATVDLAQVTN